MRKLMVLAGAVVALVLAGLWLGGGFDVLLRAAIAAQREFQTSLAGAIRHLKAGQPGAVAALMAICFGYGVLHAAGPGHGKVLLGGYALANRVPMPRLVVLSLAASLAQALAAVALVYAGVLVFDWSRERMVDMAERSLTAAGHAVIGALGLWIGLRGFRILTATGLGSGGGHDHAHHDHHDHHDHGAECGCGHSHGPDLQAMAQARGWREMLALVMGVAIRPCTGAIFLLILCWRIGANTAGIAGALAMGLGTGLVTVAAAVLGATMREGAWATGLDTLAMRRVMGLAGLTVGAVLIAASALMLRPYL